MAKRSWNYTCSILHKHFLQILLESISVGTIVIHKKTGNDGYANYCGGGGGMYTWCIMGYVKIVNSVVLLSLFSLTSGSRLSPWCHGQVTKPYRQVTIVQRFHGTLMLLGLQSFAFLSITLHWDHVWTGPGKFLNGRTFYLCNPFNRNRANSVTLVFTRVRTNFCQC